MQAMGSFVMVNRRGVVGWSTLAAAVVFITGAFALAGSPLPTTANDFKEPGTQPLQSNPPEPWMITDPMPSGVENCFLCHFGFDDAATTVKPYRWRGSMHSHAYRDPIFQAAFVIAGQDAAGSQELCLRCHTPRGWIEGRATPPTGNPDGSTLFQTDINEGVTCNACHRLVDPTYEAGVNPPDDEIILNALAVNGFLPSSAGNAHMVIDPIDVRRGPYDFNEINMHPEPPHLWAHSPFHRSGDMCGTCHDVSNPVLTRVGDATPAPTDTYVLNALDTPHTVPLSAQRETEKFPEQRTYSEWKASAFANTPGGIFIPDDVNPMINRFGGNRIMVSECQHCHMPRRTGEGCAIFEPPVRDDLPDHGFVGANVFALDLLLHLYGPSGSGEFDLETVALLQRQKAETRELVSKATDASLTQTAGELAVRLTNQCGHKLLTGMPEGRRIWINVKFFDGPNLIDERGEYNQATAELNESDTKVYEQLLGIDEYMSQQTGKPVGPSFNLVLVNKVFKDNRIPPRGFDNAVFNSIQAGHYGYAYADGQYWDDTRYCIPIGATRAEVKVYYQTSSKEYIEFLRDENTTDGRGTLLYNAWDAVGRSEPVLMDDVAIDIAPFVVGDVTNDRSVSFADITRILSNFGVGIGQNPGAQLDQGDANCDGEVNFTDIGLVLSNFGASV